MDQLKAVSIVSQNEKELKKYTDDLYDYSARRVELKKFYNTELQNLKDYKKENQISIDEYNLKKEELINIYKEKDKELFEILELTYSIAHNKSDISNKLKENIDYKQLAAEYNKKIEEIKTDDNLSAEEQKLRKRLEARNYAILKKNVSSKVVAILAFVITPVILLVGLLVNYLWYFEVANNQKFSFSNSSHLVGFIMMIIGTLLIIGFLTFMLLKSSKRLFFDKEENLFKCSLIGGIGSFTDTIGVGSFAVTVAMLNATDTVKNVKNLPGTLNIGLTIPNLFAGTLFVSAISVEIPTLVSLVVAAMIGAFLGAKLVNKVNKSFIAIFVAIALSVAGIFMLLGQVGVIGKVDEAKPNGLHGWQLAVGIIGFLIFGGLQSFGVGVYAPALALISLLDMNLAAAFPIMTCAAGFALPTTAWTFHRDNNYNPKVSYGLTIGGAIGTIVAFLIVFVGIQGGGGISMDEFTWYLKWFAIVVMYYASFMLLKKFLGFRKESKNQIEIPKTINVYQNNFKDSSKLLDKHMNIIVNLLNEKDELQKIINSQNITIKKW